MRSTRLMPVRVSVVNSAGPVLGLESGSYRFLDYSPVEAARLERARAFVRTLNRAMGGGAGGQCEPPARGVDRLVHDILATQLPKGVFPDRKADRGAA